jgi:adenosylcobyric acid synthase
MGATIGPGLSKPMLDLDGRPDGAVSETSRVLGCYVHGLFASDPFRQAFLSRFRTGTTGELAYEASVDRILDALADHLENHLDIEALHASAGIVHETN